MYNFVFWFFYRFFEWRKRFRSVFVATSIVGLTMVLHLALIYSILRSLDLFIVDPWEGSYGRRKYLLIGGAIVFFLLVYLLYYRSNAKGILENYKDKQFSILKNVLIIVMLLVVPLIMIFILN
jgi:hypothetical protein